MFRPAGYVERNTLVDGMLNLRSASTRFISARRCHGGGFKP